MPKLSSSIINLRFSGLSELITEGSEEDFNKIIKDFYEQVDVTIRMHNGIIHDFSGDTFIAFFEGKSSQTHAVEAVQECREKYDTFFKARDLSDKVTFKAGIAWGEIWKYDDPGQQGTHSFKIMGEALDTASSLQHFAENSQVLVNRGIFESTQNDWNYNKLEAIPMEGSKILLEMYELKDKKHKKLKPNLSVERKIFSDMVGRDEEVAIIESKINELINGKGSVLSVVAKAGIGKSRLIAEVMAQPFTEKLVVMEGRAVSMGNNLSFHPIIQILKSWAGILDDEVPVSAADKLKITVQRVAGDQFDEIFPFLATMMGLPLSGRNKERVEGIEGESLEALILKNLRELIILASHTRPLLIVLEDLHWVDNSSITFLESLYKLVKHNQVVFINVLRPGYPETGDYLLNYLDTKLEESHVNINLSALHAEDSAVMIANLLHKAMMPVDVAQMIISKTQGNPFFIEEVIRDFIDEGIIEIRENEFIVTEKIKDASIPENVNDVILSRVDKLDEKTKELLKTASVIGRNFYYKVLEEAADTIEELDERLNYLKDIQLISESKKKNEIEYLFKHALAQQLSYDTILQQSKKELHQKIARSIEKVFHENINDFYGTLVYHYTEAENVGKAKEYMIKAGDESRRSGASSEALKFYQDALNAMPEKTKEDINDDEVRDLRTRIAQMYHAVGRNMEAVELFEQMFRQYYKYRLARTETGIMIKGLIAIFKLRFVFKYQSWFFRKKLDPDLETIFKNVDEWGFALTTVNPKHFVLKTPDMGVKFIKYDLRNSSMGIATITNLAATFVWGNFSYKTANNILRFVEASNRLNIPYNLIRYGYTKKILEYNSGQWSDDKAGFNKVFETGMKVGEVWPVTIYTIYYGLQQIELGDYENVSNVINKLKGIADTFENTHAKAQTYRLKAFSLIKYRKLDSLQELLDEGIEYIQITNHNSLLFILYLIQTQLHIYNKDLAKASDSISMAERLLKENSNVSVMYTHYLIAKLQLEFELLKTQQPNEKDQDQKIRELLKLSDTLIKKLPRLVSNYPEAYILKARILACQKKYNKSIKSIDLAIAAAEKYNGRLELSRAYFEMGKILLNKDVRQNVFNGQNGHDYLEKAKVLFVEMNLKHDLKEYNEFMNNMK